MSDDAFRERFRTELARRGIDERQWAAEVLGTSLGRFVALTNYPARLDSSPCVVESAGGLFWYWSSSVATLEEWLALHEPRPSFFDRRTSTWSKWPGEPATLRHEWNEEAHGEPMQSCSCEGCLPPFAFSTTGQGRERLGVTGGNVFADGSANAIARDVFGRIRGLYLPSKPAEATPPPPIADP